jgi:hypothetical protein
MAGRDQFSTSAVVAVDRQVRQFPRRDGHQREGVIYLGKGCDFRNPPIYICAFLLARRLTIMLMPSRRSRVFLEEEAIFQVMLAESTLSSFFRYVREYPANNLFPRS